MDMNNIFTESEKVELKQKLNDTLPKEMVAFLNTNGGSVYIGVENGGNIISPNSTQDDTQDDTQDTQDVPQGVPQGVSQDLSWMQCAPNFCPAYIMSPVKASVFFSRFHRLSQSLFTVEGRTRGRALRF